MAFPYITSDQMQMMSVGLGFLSSYSQAQNAKSQGKVRKILGGIEAETLLKNATLRMNQGVREGQYEAYKGRVAISDTTANMVAGGSQLDPVILAKLKARADENTMAAVFDAQIDASSLRQQAIAARAGANFQARAGEMKAGDIMLSAVSTAFTNWPRTGIKGDDFQTVTRRNKERVSGRESYGL